MDLSPLGLVVGHATDYAGATGVTVIRGADAPMRAGVAVLGRATGSRELPTVSADHLVNGRIDAIVLTGGSAYGLDAAAGVMRWMEERKRGFDVGSGVVPIVPAAVVFDLAPLGTFDARPTAEMAYHAANDATSVVMEGSVGVGAGTTIGKIFGASSAMKSGFGCATVASGDGAVTVAAMVVVNAFGDVRDARGEIIAGARAANGAFADTVRVLNRGDVAHPEKFEAAALRNTTLAVVASSAPLSSIELTQIARAAAGALYKRITPVGTSFDGDVIFAVSPERGERAPLEPMIIESLAVSALERAIERAATLARGRDGIPGYADDHGH